ncbi:MAG: metallophosphoesterase family protein [Planctomycetota bacterium]
MRVRAAARCVVLLGLLLAQPSARAQSPEAEPLRFGLAADTNVSRAERTTRHWRDMAGLAQQLDLDFVLIAGDIVNNPRDQQQWQRLAQLLEETDILIETVPGNHELIIAHEDRDNVFNRVFSFERYHAVTGRPTNRSFRRGNAYFITLYSGGLKCNDTGWADYLTRELDAAHADDTIDWVFVVDHFNPRDECFPHAMPRFDGFDRPALVAQALEGHDRVIWLSGEHSSRYSHQINRGTEPYAEFVPRENRSSPGFWQFTLHADGRLTAQIAEAHTDKNKHRRVELTVPARAVSEPGL